MKLQSIISTSFEKELIFLNTFAEFMRQLPHKLLAYLSDIVPYAKLLWKWTESNQTYRIIMIVAGVIVVLLLLRLIIGLMKKGKKGKGDLVFGIFFLLALSSCAIWVCGRQLSRTQLPESEVVRFESEEALSYDRYALSYGKLMPSLGASAMNHCWHLEDDTISYKTADGAVLQTTGIRSLCEDRQYRVDSLWHENGNTFVGMSFNDLQQGQNGVYDTRSGWVIIAVLPNRQLQQQAWYRQANSTVTAASIFEPDVTCDYTVLENNEDSVVFCMQYVMYGMTAACKAQQMGPDLVVVISCGRSNYWRSSGGVIDTPVYDPVTDSAIREYLLAPVQSLLNGRIRLVRNLSEEDLARILPSKIVDYPQQFSPMLIFKGSFHAPCKELLELRGETSEYTTLEAYTMRWIAEGPDGSEMLYTLTNCGSWLRDGNNDEHFALLKQWKEHDFREKADQKMTDFLGLKAIACEGGWILSPGPYMGEGPGDTLFYYLTMEPYQP